MKDRFSSSVRYPPYALFFFLNPSCSLMGLPIGARFSKLRLSVTVVSALQILRVWLVLLTRLRIDIETHVCFIFCNVFADVAVTGLPEPRKDHAVVMSRFARDCLKRMRPLVKKLEVQLGPDTGTISNLKCASRCHLYHFFSIATVGDIFADPCSSRCSYTGDLNLRIGIHR